MKRCLIPSSQVKRIFSQVRNDRMLVTKHNLVVEASCPQEKEDKILIQEFKEPLKTPTNSGKPKPKNKEITRIDLSTLMDLDLKEAGYWFNCMAFIVSYSLVVTFAMNAIWGYGIGSAGTQHGLVNLFYCNYFKIIPRINRLWLC